MGANYLVQLAAEWYELQGFMVRRNISVAGPGKTGSVVLDVVAYKPEAGEIVHLEASMDSDSWQKRDKRFRAKFKAGQAYCDSLAAHMKKTPQISRCALLVYAKSARRQSLGGGKLLLMPQFLYEITQALSQRRVEKQIVPEHLPLMRTLQFVTEYREDLFARDWLF